MADDLTTWKQIKVFLSSTFQDMQAERNYLVKVTFPALRERLAEYHLNLIDIDLRWGVSEQEVQKGKLLKVIFDEVDACYPFFIAHLGERYGTILPDLPPAIIKRYNLGVAFSNKSVTEQEILYALLTRKQYENHVFFYFRDPAFLNDKNIPEAIKKEYIEVDPDKATKLKDLKKTITGRMKSYSSENVDNHPGARLFVDYPAEWDIKKNQVTGLEVFGAAVFKDLWSAIEVEYDLRARREAIAAQHLNGTAIFDQSAFIQNYLQSYVHRDHVQTRLQDHVHGDETKPLLLFGVHGSGISTALSWLYRLVDKNGKGALLYANFAGSTSQSTSLNKFLGYIYDDLQPRLGLHIQTGTDLSSRINLFHTLISRLEDGPFCLIIIDALQLLVEENLTHLYFLPDKLPKNVKIIVGYRAVTADLERTVKSANLKGLITYEIPLLTDFEMVRMVKKIPLLSAKRLEKQQIALLRTNYATRNPLFLSVSLAELRGFGSFSALTDRIERFPRFKKNVKEIGLCLHELFDQVIDRICEDFAPELVQDILTLVACSRNGIEEKFLISEVAQANAEKKEEAFAILRQIRSYVVYRENKIDLSHDEFRKCILDRFLSSPALLRHQYHRLSQHYSGLGDNLAWYLYKAEEWDNLANLLSASIYNFGAYLVTEPEETKMYWRAIESKSARKIPEAYAGYLNSSDQELFQSINQNNIYLINYQLLAMFLHDMGYSDLAQKVQILCGRLHHEMHSDEFVVDAINSAKMQIISKEYVKAHDLLEQAEVYLENRPLPELRCAVINTRADLYLHQSKLIEAREELQKIDPYRSLPGCRAQIAETCHLLAELDLRAVTPNYQQALHYEQESQKILIEIGGVLWINYCRQADIYMKMEEFEQAAESYGEAEVLLESQGNPKDYQNILHKKAISYISLSEKHGQSETNKLKYSSDAIFYLSLEEDICRQNGYKSELLYSLWNQAVVSEVRNDYEKAYNKLEEAEKYLAENFDTKEQLALINECNIFKINILMNHASRLRQRAVHLPQMSDYIKIAQSKARQALEIAIAGEMEQKLIDKIKAFEKELDSLG